VTQNWGPPNQGQQWPNQNPWGPPTNTWPPPAQPQQAANPWANVPPQQAANPWVAQAQAQASQPYQAQPYQQQPYGAQPFQASAPQYGAPYGIPGSFAPQPRRNRNGLNIFLGLAVVVGFVFFVGALTSYLGGGNDTVTTAGTATEQTASPTSTPTATTPTGVPDPDYSPSELPAPDSYAQATKWMKSNAVYSQSVTVPTECALPKIDITKASTKALENHLNQTTACLWMVWNPPLTKAGFELPRPPVTVYTSTITTPCGTAETGNAFYCAADQHIYYAKDLYEILPKSVQKANFVAEMVMAHEFGHAIQARTGILISEKYWEKKSSDAEGRVYSRRTEVQADCLSGMFLNSVAQPSNLSDSDRTLLKELAYDLGDDVLTGKANYDGDHGSGKSRQAWFNTGLTNTSIGSCNTYTVAASKVR
jgi:uncharacterized protein